MPGINTLAYYKHLYISTIKSFITLSRGTNVIKPFFFVANEEAD